MSGIKKNFFYSAFLTTANYIFPLLTFPYVTRVLGVANFGICGFIDGIINYFILFSTMGIAVVGIREISVTKSKIDKMNETFVDLLMINAIFTVISVLALIVCTYLVPKLYEQKELMFMGAFKIGFNFLLIEWFYKGIEDFKFITIRSLIVKCVYVVGVFCFVRNRDDYPIYYLLSVIMVALNALINIFYSKKWIKFNFTHLQLKRYFRPLMTYGVYAILTSFYTTFNVAYLGFVSTDTEVGYYTTASRLYTIFISIITAFTGVMMPKMSSLLAEGRLEDFKSMYDKSVNVLCGVTLPIIFFVLVMTPEIIELIAGSGYGGADVPLMIMIPLVFIIGYEQIMVVQGLMPMRQDSVVLRNSIWGAIVGVGANVVLVKHFAAVGSALVWLSCEILIMILSQIAINRCVGKKFPYEVVFKNMLVYSPLFALYWLKNIIRVNNFLLLLIAGCVAAMYYIYVQLRVFPESLCGVLLRQMLAKLKLRI